MPDPFFEMRFRAFFEFCDNLFNSEDTIAVAISTFDHRILIDELINVEIEIK